VVSAEDGKTKSLFWVIEQWILYVPLLFLLYNNLNVLISMSKNPWGHTEIHFIVWRHELHSLTVVYLTIFYLLLFFYFYRGLDPIIRVGCSTVIPLFGLFFYEFWWHLGCWIVWRWCMPTFWGPFTITIAICIYIIHQRYNILDLTMNKRVLILLPTLFFLFLGGWWVLLEQGFYQSLLSYEHGMGPDPHGWLIFLDKGIAILMWLLVVREVPIKRLLDGGAEIRRKKLEQWNPIQRWWHTHKISQVMQHVSNGPGKVLDLGCGCGDLFEPLRAKGKEIIAVDNDSDVIEYLKSNKDLTNVYLVNQDVTSTDVESNSINIVLALDIIEHVPQQEKLIMEIKRVLKHNGILILTTPHNTILWRTIWRIWSMIISYDEHKAFSTPDISLLLVDNGMLPLWIRTTHFGCLILSVSKKVN